MARARGYTTTSHTRQEWKKEQVEARQEIDRSGTQRNTSSQVDGCPSISRQLSKASSTWINESNKSPDSSPLDDSLDLHKAVREIDKETLEAIRYDRKTLDFLLGRREHTPLTLEELQQDSVSGPTEQLSKDRVRSKNSAQEADRSPTVTAKMPAMQPNAFRPSSSTFRPANLNIVPLNRIV